MKTIRKSGKQEAAEQMNLETWKSGNQNNCADHSWFPGFQILFVAEGFSAADGLPTTMTLHFSHGEKPPS
jgi:hypothetical protein